MPKVTKVIYITPYDRKEQGVIESVATLIEPTSVTNGKPFHTYIISETQLKEILAKLTILKGYMG